MHILSATDQITDDPIDQNNVLLRGETMNINSSDPVWTENTCLVDDTEYYGGMSFKHGNNSTGLSNCINAPLPEHLCNGNFEQYDPVLNTTYSGVLGLKNAKALIPGTGAFAGQSDIVNWISEEQQPFMGYQAFVHVRGGLGGNTAAMNNTNINYFNATGYTFSWNNTTSDVMIALKTRKQGAIQIKGQVKTELAQTMNNVYSFYELSFNYLVSANWTAFMASNPGPFAQEVDFVLKGAGVPDIVIGGSTQTLPVFNTHTTPGWANQTYTFATPANASSYTHLVIRSQYPNASGNYLQMVWFDDVSLVPVPVQQWPQLINTNDNDPTHRRIHVDASNNVYVGVNLNSGSYNATANVGNPPTSTLSAGQRAAFILVKYNSNGDVLWSRIFPHLQLGDFDFDSSGDVVLAGYYDPPVSPLPTTNPGIAGLTLTNIAGTTAAFWQSKNLLVGKLDQTTGNTDYLELHGGNGDEVGLDLTMNGNQTYILADILGNSNTGAAIGRIDWAIGMSPTSAAILEGTFGASSVSTVDVFFNIGNDPTSIALHGTDLYGLTQSRVLRINLALANNPINSDFGLTDGYSMHVSNSGQLFVTRPQQGEVVRYNAGLTNKATANPTTGTPLAVSTNGSDVYFAGIQGNIISDFWVCKYDFTADDSDWDKYSSGSNTNVELYGAFAPGKIQVDMVKHTGNKHLFIGNFDASGSPWSISFDTKTLTGTAYVEKQYEFISYIDDLGSNGQFKMEPVSTNHAHGLRLFPNPASNKLTIEAESSITHIMLSALNGTALLQEKGSFTQVQQLSLPELANGLYILTVHTNNRVYEEKLVIQH